MTTVDPERLREAMADAQMDQSALARAVGCTPGAINQILQGGVQRSRFLPDILGVLGVNYDWLIGEDAPKWPQGGSSAARINFDEHQLVDDRRELRLQDQRALNRIASALRLADEQARGIYRLPPEAALARMFVGLLAGLPEDAGRDEQALLLAQRLPIGLGQLRDLLPDGVAPPPARRPARAKLAAAQPA